MILKCEKCGTEMFVRVKPRSNNENRYYWDQVVGNISDYTGFAPEEVHEILKQKFLKTVRGRYEFARSTSGLTTTEFEDYLSKIRQWANEDLGVYIPTPNEHRNTNLE